MATKTCKKSLVYPEQPDFSSNIHISTTLPAQPYHDVDEDNGKQ